MRSVDSNIVAQLQSGQLKPFLLLHLDIDSVDYYYTDCQVPIALDSNLYMPRAFEASSIRYSANQIVDKANLTIDNLDDALTSAFVGSEPQGSDVTLSLVVLDTNNQPAGGASSALFYGEIDDWALRDGQIEFGLVNKYARWPKKQTARHPSSCRWREFKDADCQYSGSDTTCDRTYAACVAKSNSDNFGGFRWLPSIEGREVWWGKTPK